MVSQAVRDTDIYLIYRLCCIALLGLVVLVLVRKALDYRVAVAHPHGTGCCCAMDICVWIFSTGLALRALPVAVVRPLSPLGRAIVLRTASCQCHAELQAFLAQGALCYTATSVSGTVAAHQESPPGHALSNTQQELVPAQQRYSTCCTLPHGAGL